MDSISQAALGGAIGEAMLGRKAGYKGSLAGAVIATIPDLDVLLLPIYSPLQRISIHRGYSHSIIFSIVAGLLLAMALQRMRWSRQVQFAYLFLFTWSVLITHLMLDTFTSYGTQLFLPFTNYRAGFDSITIVDPVYTLSLLCGLVLALTVFRRRPEQRRAANVAGLIISTVYLLLTLYNKTSIDQTFRTALSEQQISFEKMKTIPVSAANVHWYGAASDSEYLYLGDYSQLRRDTIKFERFPINEHLLDGLDEQLTDKLKWFAKDFYTVAEKDGQIRFYNLQCDMQGIRTYGDYKAPTAFYYEITPGEDGSYKLKSRMHRADEE